MPTWDAGDYSRHSSEQQKWARELIGKLVLRGHERALDIGCGDGKVTAEIARCLPHGSVLGIDISAEMIEFARSNHPSADFANLRFELGDASRLEFNSEFDIIFSNAVLHWIIDHRPVLRGISRALKPAGRALLQMGGAGNAAEVIAVMNDLMCRPRWRQFFEGFQFPYGFHAPAEYRLWMTEAGLTPVRVELIPKDMMHKGPEGLAGWVRTTWMPYTHRVPETRREQFITELVFGYIADHPPDAEGNVHLKMVRLEAEAMQAST